MTMSREWIAIGWIKKVPDSNRKDVQRSWRKIRLSEGSIVWHAWLQIILMANRLMWGCAMHALCVCVWGLQY